MKVEEKKNVKSGILLGCNISALSIFFSIQQMSHLCLAIYDILSFTLLYLQLPAYLFCVHYFEPCKTSNLIKWHEERKREISVEISSCGMSCYVKSALPNYNYWNKWFFHESDLSVLTSLEFCCMTCVMLRGFIQPWKWG